MMIDLLVVEVIPDVMTMTDLLVVEVILDVVTMFFLDVARLTGLWAAEVIRDALKMIFPGGGKWMLMTGFFEVQVVQVVNSFLCLESLPFVDLPNLNSHLDY